MAKLGKIIKAFFTFLFTTIFTAFLLILPFALLYFTQQLEEIVYLFFFAVYYLLIGHFGIKAIVTLFKDIGTKDSSKNQKGGLYTTIITNQALPAKSLVVYLKKLENLKIETNYDDLDLSMRKKLEKLILPNHQKKIFSHRVMTVNNVLFGVNLSESYISLNKDGSKKIKLSFAHSIDFSQLFEEDKYIKGDDYKKDISSVNPQLENLTAKEIAELEKLHQKKQVETFLSILKDSQPEIQKVFSQQYFKEEEEVRFVEHFNHLTDRNLYLLSDFLGFSEIGSMLEAKSDSTIKPVIIDEAYKVKESGRDWKGEQSENSRLDVRSEAKAAALESPVLSKAEENED